MLENILLILLIWLVISIPVSLLVGLFLSISTREKDRPEDVSLSEATHIAPNARKNVIDSSSH